MNVARQTEKKGIKQEAKRQLIIQNMEKIRKKKKRIVDRHKEKNKLTMYYRPNEMIKK